MNPSEKKWKPVYVVWDMQRGPVGAQPRPEFAFASQTTALHFTRNAQKGRYQVQVVACEHAESPCADREITPGTVLLVPRTVPLATHAEIMADMRYEKYLEIRARANRLGLDEDEIRILEGKGTP